MNGRRALALLFLLTLPLVTPRIRAADEIEHFAWLRSVVFDADLDFENEYRYFHARDPEGLAAFRETFLTRREPLTGRPLNFAPVGAALLWSPFYLLAHLGVLLARALGSSVAADGFSYPYLAAVSCASALYGFAGLLLAHALLQRHGGFTDATAALSVAALFLATPALYYMTIAPGFGHAASLFAVALLLWLSLRARDEAGGRPWLLAGLAGGLAACVREQDVLFLVVPAGLLALRARQPGGLAAASRQAMAVALGAALGFLPQALAYRGLTGAFRPSMLVTRKLSYLSPHAWSALLDPGHGLFFWSPILLLATLGLVVLAWRRRDATSGLLLGALGLQVWINGAIESWHLAGAFGSRRFLGATAIFAFGLAAALAAIDARFGRRAALAVVAVFCWWNISLMLQFGLKLMDRQRLEWPRVATNQFAQVPRHLGRAAWLFVTDRERLAKEGP